VHIGATWRIRCQLGWFSPVWQSPQSSRALHKSSKRNIGPTGSIQIWCSVSRKPYVIQQNTDSLRSLKSNVGQILASRLAFQHKRKIYVDPCNRLHLHRVLDANEQAIDWLIDRVTVLYTSKSTQTRSSWRRLSLSISWLGAEQLDVDVYGRATG